MYCSYSTHLNLWRESESLSVCIWRDDTCVWEILVGTRVLQLRVKSAQAAVKVQQLTITVSKPWPLNCSTSVCRPCIHKCICAREREVGWTPHCSLYANADESITESYLETKQCSSQCSNNVACHCLKINKSNTILQISCLHISQPWWQFMSDSVWILLKYTVYFVYLLCSSVHPLHNVSAVYL